MKKQWVISKIEEQQSEAAGLKSFSSTVALFLKSRGLDIGSGVLVSYKTKHYVATAAHNVRGLAKENIFITHKENDLMKDHFRGDIYYHRNKDFDLACLSVSKSEFERTGKSFIDITCAEFNYRGFSFKKHWSCVTGFPACFTERYEKKDGMIFVGGGKTLWSDIALPAGLSKKSVYLNFPKHFTTDKGITVINPSPKGLSGRNSDKGWNRNWRLYRSRNWRNLRPSR